MKKLIWLVLVFVLVFAFASSAVAKPPDHFKFFYTEPPFVEVTCDGFDVMDNVTADVQESWYYDQDGNLIRMHWHVHGVDHLYNSEAPEKFIEGNFIWNAQIDLVSGKEQYNGNFWHFTVPGYGQVYFESGRFVYQDGDLVFERGRQNFDEALLCSLLE